MADETSAPTPQTVLRPLTSAAIFLVVTIDPGGEAVTHDLLSDLNSLQHSVGFRAEPEGRLSCVTGIGSEAWDRLFAGPFRRTCIRSVR
jgi:putative iron-dependent peroxidase